VFKDLALWTGPADNLPSLEPVSTFADASANVVHFLDPKMYAYSQIPASLEVRIKFRALLQ